MAVFCLLAYALVLCWSALCDEAGARAAVVGEAAPGAHMSIVGGQSASIASFPFQVALYDSQANSPAAGFFCGGVIVDATHVITAAHCVAGIVQGSSGGVDVLAGSTSLAPTDPGSVRDPVRSSVVDPNYDPLSSDYDIALLTLAHSLWEGQVAPSVNGLDTIAPLGLDATQASIYANPNTTPAIVATASGWGEVNPAPGRTPSYPTSLRAVRLALVPESICEEEYATIEQPITPSMICAGGSSAHTDTCYGDSGGPLVVDADNPARSPQDYVLAGIVDFGNGCAQQGFAGVYTRISSPSIMSFLSSGIGKPASPLGTQARHKRKRRRRRRLRIRRAL